MSSFKDFLAADIGNVFLNTGEFADETEINGVMMPAVFAKSTTGKPSQSYAEGVSLVTHVLSVSAEVFGEEPEQGERMMVNGKTYYVVRVDEDEGLYTISLEANDA
ncbi:ATP-binding sugar transporter [Paenibacillus sophorae]|uniref:ATP-binding sugar transporter n=1 Tax=Paenibacillus sophorae TaxID=1333845 RepID=A0A1H8VSC7_9BACL|nr:hypothetical protein [Paenibacillus sophorae]QWU15682.1 hypothetical protein KP014_28350 [Paenibacillus sophorae]SEP18265.1 ATP-binding sugar transporter [Paenibacillus sophorae]